MEPELAALAASGATTMVTLMVSDAWAQARSRLSRFFARGAEVQGVGAQLDRSRSELIAAREEADGGATADVEEHWRERLCTLLRDDPDAALELRRILDESAPRTTPNVEVRNSISGGTQYGPVVQGGSFSGLTFGSTQNPNPQQGEDR
ncbi:hypothetical protein G3I40_33075 [Streptomyces sp. SID14478]|uniref:hypothetical protein n=1 Tax=Streptomyces sp. SID14478 TaxID=2706073 RepID=UPI0013D9A159|nr:hypothetical protein [Streptomyces sp. SID14478]NEB80014.1 hypothetical protein [Streptomyces sp. SID14478]